MKNMTRKDWALFVLGVGISSCFPLLGFGIITSGYLWFDTFMPVLGFFIGPILTMYAVDADGKISSTDVSIPSVDPIDIAVTAVAVAIID